VRNPIFRKVSRLASALAVALILCPLDLGAQGGGTQPGASPGRATGQQGRGGGSMLWEWWNDAEVQKELGLAPDKVRKITDIYAARTAQTTPLREEFTREMAELDQITRARTVDETAYAVKVAKVEFLRSELNKSRTVMLYRLFRELSPEQYRKLQDIRDRRDQNRGRGGSPAR
jgi:Spy/CpxP family protein refolding chaperone